MDFTKSLPFVNFLLIIQGIEIYEDSWVSRGICRGILSLMCDKAGQRAILVLGNRRWMGRGLENDEGARVRLPKIKRWSGGLGGV